MILPEHKERLNQRRREVMGRGELKKSRLSEYEMEELAYRLQEAMENGDALVLTVWSRGTVEGRIVKMDANLCADDTWRYSEGAVFF